MPENLLKKERPDRSKVTEEEDYTISYLSQKYLVPRKKVLEAILAVGNDRQQIENYLAKNSRLS